MVRTEEPWWYVVDSVKSQVSRKGKSYIWIWTPRFKIMDVLFKMNQNIQFLDYSDLMAISHEVEYKSHSLFLDFLHHDATFRALQMSNQV